MSGNLRRPPRYRIGADPKHRNEVPPVESSYDGDGNSSNLAMLEPLPR